jgi:hypothetical protein
MMQPEQHEANGSTSVNDVKGTISQGHFSMGVNTSKTFKKYYENSNYRSTAVSQNRKSTEISSFTGRNRLSRMSVDNN